MMQLSRTVATGAMVDGVDYDVPCFAFLLRSSCRCSKSVMSVEGLPHFRLTRTLRMALWRRVKYPKGRNGRILIHTVKI